jgi:hypothetical protein
MPHISVGIEDNSPNHRVMHSYGKSYKHFACNQKMKGVYRFGF